MEKKILQAQKYRNNLYLLPVSILFLKTLILIVSSIWYWPIPMYVINSKMLHDHYKFLGVPRFIFGSSFPPSLLWNMTTYSIFQI